MGRKAGDTATYRWVLMDKSQDPPVPLPGVTDIELPSVTTIIKATMAAPALLGWTYRTTLESVDMLHEYYDSIRYYREHDLDALLEVNRLRPDDIRDEAAERGTATHSYLEALASPTAEEDEERFWLATPYIQAVKDWWEKEQPVVESSEGTVVSLKYGFAGTLDLVWSGRHGAFRLTDLKTRKEGFTDPYISDLVQLDGLRIAWEETTGVPIGSTSVLVAREDGTPLEVVRNVPRGIFLKVLDLYNAVREVESA